MQKPGFYRARIDVLKHLINSLPVEGEKNSPRELLKQGFFSPELFALGNLYDLPVTSVDDYIQDQYRSKTYSNEPLTFTELCSYNTWFAMHPEKVAGQEKVTTSFHFPLTIEGNETTVKTTLQAGLEDKTVIKPNFSSSGKPQLKFERGAIVTAYGADYEVMSEMIEAKGKEWVISYQLKPKDDAGYWRWVEEKDIQRIVSIKKDEDAEKAKRIRIAKAKAQAIKIKLQLLNLDNTMKSNNYALSGLSGLDFISTLGALPIDTYNFLDDTSLGLIIAKTQEEEKKQKVKGKLSFDEVMKKYNEGISDDEIKAWVWYKRSLGIPMTAWKKYFLDESKGGIEKVVYTKRATKILNNQWKEVNLVPENTLLGKPTKFTHEYNGDNYLMITGTDGNKYIVLERDVTVKESGQSVSEEKLTPLVKKGVLFFANGELLPYPVFAYGNMYDREDQLKQDQEIIIAKYGQEIFDNHLQVVQGQRPRQISIQNPDPNERPKITVFSDFALRFYVTDLAEDLAVDVPRRTTDEGLEGYNLKEAFMFFLDTLNREDFGVLTAREIWRYYVEAGSTRGLSDAYKATVEQYAPIEGEALFARFLHEGLASKDKQKLDYEWNRVFNGFSNIPYHRIPVGFECSNSFMQADNLEFSPAQREAIAFMQASGSGIVAYDVGVGKTMSAIITVANALYEGKTKRPVIVVPNATYDKWKREIFGFTDEKTKEHFPGVLSYTGIKLNDWYNLGSAIKKKVKLDKAVPENSITLLTYEGFTQIGYSRKVMDELFDELSEILTQKPREGKRSSRRDYEGKAEKYRKMIGMGNKKTVADIDTLGFDFICLDEAHNMKNVFVNNPTDEEGNNRYRFQEKEPSERGIKAFFLCNFVQRRFGRNVMLLTATPFTNSPMEIYSMLSLVALDTLKKMGIKNLQTFMETFIVQDLEYVAKLDDELELQAVIKRFNNRLVLQKVIHNSITYKTGEDAGVKRPCKINLPRLYTKNQHGDTVKLVPNEQILTYLQMTEEQEELQARVVAMAKDPRSNPFQLMGWSLANAISPFLIKGYPRPPKDYLEFVHSSPKIQYTVECIKTVKQWHEERNEPVSGQVIYMNRGKDFFPLIKQYLEENAGYAMGVKHQGRKFDEVELITSGMSADRKEAIKDAFLDNVVKVIIGTSTITEGIDLQKYGTVLYILQPDWNPTAIKQVEGRIHRQKNTFGYVRIVMPLVQNSMDVFVFQKLEEKTARINDIWYRADRGNVLDQESLDPEEVKFALFTNVHELAKVELDKVKKEVERKKEVSVSNIQLLNELKAVITYYYDHQKQLRDLISSTITKQHSYWANPDHYLNARWFLSLTEANRKKAIDKAQEVLKEAELFRDTGMTDDKELIRVAKQFSKLLQDTQQYNENYQFTKLINDFRNYLSQVRKAEQTTLAQKGYTINDDFSNVIAEYMREKEMYEQELNRVGSVEYFQMLMTEVQEKKDKLAIKGATIEERAQEFASLNYLLQFSAGQVEQYGHCMLPNKDGYVPSSEENVAQEQAIADRILAQEVEINQEDRKRKILVAKAKAKAIKIKLQLLELDLEAA